MLLKDKYMVMPINKAEYNDLKEYWDYQRKVQYNKEVIHRMAEQFENRIHNEFGALSLDDIKDLLWSRIKSEEYEDPHTDWVPSEPTLRFEWETDPNMPKELPKPKGRPVVVKARDKWKEDFEKYINDDNNI